MEEDYGDQSFLGPNAIKKAQQMIETEVKAGWLDDNNKITWPLNFIQLSTKLDLNRIFS